MNRNSTHPTLTLGTTLTKKSTLSHRQEQILELLADDLFDKEIALQLGISEKTVEFHKHKIKQTINARGKAGMVRYAIKTGLIGP